MSTLTSDPGSVPGAHRIEVRVPELRRLFNSIDPSPFHERDLDPAAEEFIVDWSRDLPANARLVLVIHLEREPPVAGEATVVGNAIHQFFARRALDARRRLRDLFRRGRSGLVIALAFLALMIAVGDSIAAYFPGTRLGDVVREGFLIGGWVAMWRPIEIFLYDWWPIRGEIRLFERLASMPATIE